MDMNSPIVALKGIGEKTAKLFEKLGVYTVRDILLAFPRDYKKFEEPVCIETLRAGMECAIYATVDGMPLVKSTRSMNVTLVRVSDDTGKLQLIWFRAPYIRSTLKRGERYLFYGKIVTNNNQLTLEQPVIYSKEQYRQKLDTLQPVYALVKGITNNLMTKTMHQSIDAIDYEVEYLPEELLSIYQLKDYYEALREIHFPTNMEHLIVARNRLVFDEFFLFILQMQLFKTSTSRMSNHFDFAEDDFVAEQIARLPYELTGAQRNAIKDILQDMRSPYAMQRLLQGDVGSGKTIVAFLAMILAAHSGYQSAIMAPTDVLARQHYETFTGWCKDFGLNFPVILLTGSLTTKEKRRAYDRIECFPNALIVGTHALIQERVIYKHLALVVTDEQHRFGVRQREIFAKKGLEPHVLVMSATPIPRTLAIILYGDLDITIIDELPANRLPIKNCVVGESYRPTAWKFIRSEIEKGHQAYIICPLVEESENLDAENVTDYADKLAKDSGGSIRVAYLHGKMKPAEKNEIMEQYLRNEIQVLISTTVIEVGVNVPNATVMMIENADRFGLAQLHQLRGRVGRGAAQSYCIMMNSSDTDVAKKRLDILNQSNDGFFIAREDLKLRGPGDFFGIRQSGILEFKLADIIGDAGMLQKASSAVNLLLEKDPALERPEHAKLRGIIDDYIVQQNKNLNL